jgi:hypothetical protein
VYSNRIVYLWKHWGVKWLEPYYEFIFCFHCSVPWEVFNITIVIHIEEFAQFLLLWFDSFQFYLLYCEFHKAQWYGHFKVHYWWSRFFVFVALIEIARTVPTWNFDCVNLTPPSMIFHSYTFVVWYFKELVIKETTSSVSFLDIYLKCDTNGHFFTRLYDIRDDFSFNIINFSRVKCLCMFHFTLEFVIPVL